MYCFRYSRAVVVGFLALAFAGAGRADAQEFCVACSEPNAIYRCVIDGAQPGGVTPLQVQCITAMSKAGGHATCAIKRGTVFDCTGPIKRVPWSASAEEVPAPLPPPKPDAAAAPDSKQPPNTVLEMADRANKKTAEDMKKAGETMKDGAQNVGDNMSKATKKTWDCLVSLFSKC